MEIMCEVCPSVNINDDKGNVMSVKHCILKAAIKHNEQYYQVCGIERELNLTPPQEVSDAVQFAGDIDSNVVEAELVE